MHLDRLVIILEAVAAAGRDVSAADVQRVTGLPRPTCYRLLRTLAEHRLLDEPEGGSGFRIGRRLAQIALLGQTDGDIRTIAAPILKSAAVAFGEAVFLSRLRGKAIEIIHVETPDDMRRSFVHPGLGARPIHACSCSKAVAAFSDDAFQDKVLAGHLRAYTDHTKTDAAEIAREFAAIRQQGLCGMCGRGRGRRLQHCRPGAMGGDGRGVQCRARQAPSADFRPITASRLAQPLCRSRKKSPRI